MIRLSVYDSSRGFSAVNTVTRLALTAFALSVLAFQTPFVAGQQMNPPVAQKIPHELEKHGHVRNDEYFWLRDRDDAKVIEYLTAENEYTKQQLAETEALQTKLADEIKARIKQTDVSVPYPDNGYTYYSRTVDGKSYSINCRKKIADGAEEEVILDVNQVAEGHEFCSVAGMKVSPNNRLLAYAVDLVGRRKYTIKFKDLQTGETLPDEIKDVTSNFVWAADNQTIFYGDKDPETLRSYQIYRHRLGTDRSADQLVFEEADETFNCFVYKTRSRKYIIIGSFQTLSSELRFLDASTPEAEPTVFHPREENHEYSADHMGDHFCIRTNWNAENFCLMKTPDSATSKDNWQTVIAHDADVYLDDVDLFEDYLVVQTRKNALTHITIRDWDGNGHDLDFGEPCYVANTSVTPDESTDWLRYSFTSLVTPRSTFEYNMKTREKRLLKQTEVLGGFDTGNFTSQRLWATARDGVKVPVSLVHHKDTPIDGTAPCLLYSYGSYGSSTDPYFRSSRLNLLDRGFVYAIAHIRGGQELGRKWYEDGKLLKKKNTFTDFIDVGRFLVENKYADADRLYAQGGSAGGLLMGAVANMAPGLFHGIIADVPFVDVVTTMLDDSIPLTTGEYDEWGNPNVKEYYDYMLSYSPYDNVEAKEYPNMLVLTGLHDSQVQYWEPAKWVARLRDKKIDNNLLILRTNMTAGHGGASGRYEIYKEIALEHAFLLHLAGIKE